VTITATLALQYTAICAVLGVTMTTVESIWHWRRGNFGETGIWPWYILREDHNPLASAVLTPALDGAGLLALLLARLAAAILVPVCYGAGLNAGLPLLILIVSQFLLAWRTRLGNEGGDQMTNIMLIMAFLPQALPNEPAIANLAVLFVGAQILLSYIASGGAKLFGPKWQRGEALADIMNQFQYGNYWLMRQLRAHPFVCRLICFSVILFQLSFPLFFLLPAPYAYIYIAGGVAFHFGIAYFMRLYLFVLTFLGTYPCLIFAREAFRSYVGL
jgi:hypothetical protein